MSCFDPLVAWRTARGSVVFSHGGDCKEQLLLPCGKCTGCKLERARQWAVRCMHEASLSEENCFITLTYSDEYLPYLASLDRRAFPLFMKRLRKEIAPRKVRYFHCGEYGTQFGRPHYHACLFGFDFGDKRARSERGGYPVFRSALLEKLWPFGLSELGTLTYESAAYVARYVVGKLEGESFYQMDEGEGPEREREYSTMSRGGRAGRGIGYGWLERFATEVYPADGVVVNGRLRKPPRYYDVAIELVEPDVFERVRAERRVRAREYDERELKARQVIAEQRLSLSRRELE